MRCACFAMGSQHEVPGWGSVVAKQTAGGGTASAVSEVHIVATTPRNCLQFSLGHLQSTSNTILAIYHLQ